MLGVFLIWYTYHNTSATDRANILEAIRNADYFWVIISVLMGSLSHVSRAMRWNLLLQPMGYSPRFWNNFMAILAGYLANLGIPRSGEVLRATTISGYEQIPFEKSFGTIVAERIVDMIMLLLVVVIAAILQTDIILEFLTARNYSLNNLLLALLAVTVSGILFLYVVRNSDHKLFKRIRVFISGLWEGLTSIFKMKRKGLFLLHTLLIWGLYIGMFIVIKYSIPETRDAGMSAIIVAFVAGAFAMSATNGGIGVYPIAVAKVLTLYGIPAAAGDAFGWIMWTSQTLMVIIFGGLSFFLLPLYNKRK